VKTPSAALLLVSLLLPACAAWAESPDFVGAWTGTAVFDGGGQEVTAKVALSLTADAEKPENSTTFTLVIEDTDDKRRISMGRVSSDGGDTFLLPERRVVTAEGVFSTPRIAAAGTHSLRYDPGPPEQITTEPGAFFGDQGFRFSLTRIVR